MRNPKYLEQYERTMRWYWRFIKINHGQIHQKNSDFYQDEVYSFFINCYHLKDWIINDPVVKINKDDIEKFVHNNKYLNICGDICNGVKHLQLNKSNGAKIGSSHFSLELGRGTPVLSVRYDIEIDGKKYDAFKVANEAVKQWDNFIKRRINFQ
ncbi:MAG: hypothetical protein WCV50_01800 [Patescibacteria group bacterium]|jgi:hypothetical protein